MIQRIFFKISFLLILILLAKNLEIHAQNVAVSAPYKVLDATFKKYFIAGENIIAVKVEKDHFFIQKYKADLPQFISLKEYSDMPKGFVLENILQFKGRLYVFYSLFDRPSKSDHLHAREISFASGEFIDKGKLLIKSTKEVEELTVLSIYNKYDTKEKFQFRTSADSTKILIYYDFKREGKLVATDKANTGMAVFDSALNQLWSKDVTMPYAQNKMWKIAFLVANNGSAFVMGRVFEGVFKPDAIYCPSHLELFNFYGDSIRFQTLAIRFPNKEVNQIRLCEIAGKYIHAAGFYHNVKSGNGSDGLYTFKAGFDGKVFDQQAYPFSASILKPYAKETAPEKNTAEAKNGQFKDLSVEEIHVNKDGSFLLIGEESSTYSTASSTGATRQYFHEDIFVSKLNPLGGLQWMLRLPKEQTGALYNGALGSKFFSQGAKSYFLFMDAPGNAGLPQGKKPSTYYEGREGILSAYEVNDEDGSYKRTTILNDEKLNNMSIEQFSFSRLVLSGVNSFIFEAYKKKKEDVLIKVSF